MISTSSKFESWRSPTSPEDKAGAVRRSIRTSHSVDIVEREIDVLLVLCLDRQLASTAVYGAMTNLFVLCKANLTAPRFKPHSDVLVLFILPLYPASRKWSFGRYSLEGQLIR